MKLFKSAILSCLCLVMLACGGDSNSPKLVSVSPTEGPEAGGITLTMRGKNFVEIMEILIGGKRCEPINVISETELTCVLGANPAVLTDSVVDIEIRNITGYNDKLREAFTYRAE